MNNPVVLMVFGVVVGLFSGLMGLGGGVVMIPIMVLVYGMSQQLAQGTSLAVILFPAIPGAVGYYMAKNGDGTRNVNLAMAAWMAPGAMAAAVFGAKLANTIHPATLKLIFGFVLIYVASYGIFAKGGVVRGVVISFVVVAVAMGLFVGLQWYDKTGAGAMVR